MARRGPRRRPRSGRGRGPFVDYLPARSRCRGRDPRPDPSDSTEGARMIDAIGSALAGLSAAQGRMDALADDTANVDTTGFKAAGRDSVQGGLIETGQPLDLAIEGAGAFQLAGGGQTRDGAFQLDASAQIVTS